MRVPAFVPSSNMPQRSGANTVPVQSATQPLTMQAHSNMVGRLGMARNDMGLAPLGANDVLGRSNRLNILTGAGQSVAGLRRQQGQSLLTMRASKQPQESAPDDQSSDIDTSGVWVDDSLLGQQPEQKKTGQRQGKNAATPSIPQPAQPSEPTAPKPMAPPHDEAIWQRTNRIITALDVGEAFAPGSMDKIFEGAAGAIKGNSAPSSFLAKLATNLIDILQRQDDPQGKREYLYLMLKAADIMDETARQELGDSGKAPKSLYTSILLGQIDRLISEPQKFDPTGLMHFYDNMLSRVLGDQKSVPYDALTGLKDRMLTSLGKEDPESLTAKVKLAIYLAITIDTGQEIAVDELVEAFQDLGIPASKLAQTVGGQANNPIFKDNPMAERVLSACKILQQYNRPMTEKQALAQMAAQYEPT